MIQVEWHQVKEGTGSRRNRHTESVREEAKAGYKEKRLAYLFSA